MIKCTSCNSTMRLEEDPFQNKKTNRDLLFKIVKELAKEKISYRKTAAKFNTSAGTVIGAENNMTEYIIDKLNDISKKTNLTTREIVSLLQRKWNKDKKREQVH